MNRQIWMNIARWVPAVLVPISSIVIAFIAIMLIPILIPRICIRWADSAGLRVPVGIEMALADLVTVGMVVAVLVIPTFLAVGFAIRTPMTNRLSSGFSVCLMLLAVYVWSSSYYASFASTIAPRVFAMTAAGAVLVGIALSSRHCRVAHLHLVGNLVALILLTLPCWIALAARPSEPSTARKVWSVTLQETTWPDMNSRSAFGATRQAVFVGNRILVVFDAGHAGYVGNQPMSHYRLLSLDVETGAVKNSREFTGHWGAIPSLYATNDGHAILADGALMSLNTDLTPAPPQFTPGKGRVNHISPDGTMMGWETFPGTTFVDSHTLKPLNRHFDESVPTSISAEAVVTNNVSWYGQYPKERSFVTLTDERGQRLLFHSPDRCGGRPEFLSNEEILLVGCNKIWMLGVKGEFVREAFPFEGAGVFAGVSQDGKRFAIQYAAARGDPPDLVYERFVVFDTKSLTPVSMIPISDLPDFQSWSALSSDGHRFVAGKPGNLALYELP